MSLKLEFVMAADATPVKEISQEASSPVPTIGDTVEWFTELGQPETLQIEGRRFIRDQHNLLTRIRLLCAKAES
jgi:hypothetical protein